MADRITIQITDPAEYGVTHFAIEANDWFHLGETRFAVPAWEERGLPDLCGPFATREKAAAVLKREREYLEWLGYRVAA